MPDLIISALPQTLLASQAADGDLLAIVDVSATTTKKISLLSIRSFPLETLSNVSGTPENGSILVRNGTAWVVTSLSTLTDEILPSFDDNAGKMLVVNSTEDDVEWTDPVQFPSYSSNAGKILSVNITEDGVEWVAQYPSFSSNGGKYLRVNALANGVEWGDPLPSLTGNADKYLKVTSEGDEVEWVTINFATFPNFNGAGKLLVINSTNNGVEWVQQYPNFNGAGKVLTINSTNDGVEWVVPSTGSGVETLNDLTDVNTAGATTGQVLTRQSDGTYAFDDVVVVGDFLELTDIGVSVQAYDENTAKLDIAQTWTKAQRGAIVPLTDSANIAVDFELGNFFSVTLGGARVLSNPTNIVAGQSGSIFIIAGTGTSLAYGSFWDFEGQSAPSTSTTNGTVDRLDYVVRSTTSIHARLSRNWG